MIEPTLIDSIGFTIKNGNRVNRVLPGGGKIVIDHLLPYICVYRYTTIEDFMFGQLIKTQSSYLIVGDETDVKPLLSRIVSIASKKFKSFLVLELWGNSNPEGTTFHIYCPAERSPATVKSLVTGFDDLKTIYPSLTDTKVFDSLQRQPTHLTPLLNIEENKQLGSLLIGISVPSVYREINSGHSYAISFRKFKRTFSDIIKKSAYEFIRVQTSKEYSHYLMLGKTTLDNLTRFADNQLANLSERINFIMRITPVNSHQEWEAFQENKFSKKPNFKYRLISIDPEVEKRMLYKIHIDRIDDPTLASIFRDKRLELEKQLTMLEERETKNFKYTGQSLYGVPDAKSIQIADDLLHSLQESDNQSNLLNSHDFAQRAQKEIDLYKEHFPEVDLKVQIRKDVSGVMVSKSHLLISQEFLIPTERVEALIQHEVGTHILSYCNGYQQPLRQMYAGFARYDELQEGLAVLAEYLTNGLTPDRLKLLAGRVLAVSTMLEGADFIETFNSLIEKYNFDSKTAFFITMRVFRGGGLTKDALYLTGLIQLLKYLKLDGDLKILYTGKFHLKHVPVIKELLHRKILNKPHMGAYFQLEETKNRLDALHHITDLTKLLNTKNNDHRIYN
jgi:uncharacterized protein (TIGR02421 family)